MTTYRVTITKSIDLLIEAADAEQAEYVAGEPETAGWLDWTDADEDVSSTPAPKAEAEYYVTADGKLADAWSREFPVDPTGAPWIAGLQSRKDNRLDTLSTYALDGLAVWTDARCLIAGPRTGERPPLPAVIEKSSARGWIAHRPEAPVEIPRDGIVRWLAGHEDGTKVRVAGVVVDQSQLSRVLAVLRSERITAGLLTTTSGPALHLRAGDLVAMVMSMYGGENAPAWVAP